MGEAAVSITPQVESMVDHLFRQRAGQMVAWLTRLLGPEHLELAEEVVQDALLKALQLWPHSGIPDNPGGWLFQVARNRALDVLRHNSILHGKAPRSLPKSCEANRVHTNTRSESHFRTTSCGCSSCAVIPGLPAMQVCLSA